MHIRRRLRPLPNSIPRPCHAWPSSPRSSMGRRVAPMSRLDSLWYASPLHSQSPYYIILTPHSVSQHVAYPNWLKRVSRHKVRLADVRLFVFCKQYREQAQRRGPGGVFQIQFVSDDGEWSFFGTWNQFLMDANV